MIKKAYDKYVVPKLLDVCCSTKPIKYQRDKITNLAPKELKEVLG